MDVHVRLTGRGSLSEQIYRQLLDAVLDGRLRAGERLPPTRDLSHRLEVSRNTVGLAYERLAAEGVLVGRVGDGSYVAPELARAARARRAPAGAVRPLARWDSLPAVAARPSARYDFSVGVPDASLFPFAIWRRLVSSELRPSSLRQASYAPPGGDEGLREAIARHASVSRAVRASAEDVIVTQGAQQAFHLVARVLMADGACVAVEEPGYPQVRRLFESLGGKVRGVPVDAEGVMVGAIPAAARIIYVTPSHQFPLGMPMSFSRRQALLEWAERRGAVIIEDDYDSEYRFAGRPLDPLQNLDRAGRVIYVGSFSKVLLPGLRLGFLIAPASLQSALLSARQLTDWHGDMASQRALARFIDQGFLARHVRKVTRHYADRHSRLTEALGHMLEGTLELVPTAAGLHLSAVLSPGVRVDIAEVVKRAAANGVRVAALSDFYAGKAARGGLVIGFGGIEPARIGEGMRRLAACFPTGP